MFCCMPPKDVKLNQFLIEHSDPAPGITEEQAAQLQANDQERLRQMTFYSTGKTCLRARIRRYFGEYAPKECGFCSVCAPRPWLEVHTDDFEWDTQPELTRRPRRTVPIQEEGLPYPEELYRRLKELRTALARRQGVPAYVVFTDATLRAMCRRQPTDLAGMGEVPGVGERKLRQYGPDFLTEIHAWQQEH